MSTKFRLNGARVKSGFEPDTPLLWVIRDELRLTGTKFGCGIAQCGACTVHLNDRPVRSCSLPLAAVEGAEVVTIEGLDSSIASAVTEAWQAIDVPQCGYCQSGQIMSAVGLLADKANPTDEDIDAAMSGNVCRCATYTRIRKAIRIAADKVGAKS